MAINVADNFSYKGAKPLDARTKFATITDMVATPVADLYDGCEAYVTANKKYYSFDSSNTVDETLGKWRERESGGGHTIEDSEGTSLIQRDTMQFGEGFNATDDSENEKTVVEPNLMTTADMDDVITPLPSVQSRYHKYSTEEQIVGEWIDGKSIFQKTFVMTMPTTTSQRDGAFWRGDTSVDITSLNISQLVNLTAMSSYPSICNLMPYFGYATEVEATQYAKMNAIMCWCNKSTISIRRFSSSSVNPDAGADVYVTIRYTKTTS